MRKAVYFTVFGLFILVLFGSGVSANDGKIKEGWLANTEWEITGTAKLYNSSNGNYLGSMAGASGLHVFFSEEEGATGIVAPTLVLNYGVVPGTTAEYSLYSYTLKGNVAKSTTGRVLITVPGTDPIEDYDGPIEAIYTFTGKNTMKGKVTYTNGATYVKTVIELEGKFMGKYPE
jgi:hypothetical protein